MSDTPKYVIYELEDWSVLYEDGKLKMANDSYLITEYLYRELGVETRTRS